MESLSFQGRGEPSNNTKATVLSCGGIYIPRSEIPKDFKNWHQIINLPGPELSAKIFGFSPNPSDPLEGVLRKEFQN